MKEVKEWNNKPRKMWVWDDNDDKKREMFVIYIISDEKDCAYPVIAYDEGCNDTENFRHCAEIESSELMTDKQLSRWLRRKPNREWAYSCGAYVFNNYDYNKRGGDAPVNDEILVREGDEEWKKPTKDLFEVDEEEFE